MLIYDPPLIRKKITQKTIGLGDKVWWEWDIFIIWRSFFLVKKFSQFILLGFKRFLSLQTETQSGWRCGKKKATDTTIWRPCSNDDRMYRWWWRLNVFFFFPFSFFFPIATHHAQLDTQQMDIDDGGLSSLIVASFPFPLFLWNFPRQFFLKTFSSAVFRISEDDENINYLLGMLRALPGINIKISFNKSSFQTFFSSVFAEFDMW